MILLTPEAFEMFAWKMVRARVRAGRKFMMYPEEYVVWPLLVEPNTTEGGPHQARIRWRLGIHAASSPIR